MTYDNWLSHNPNDEWLGPEPAPCRAERTGYERRVIRYGRCEACGSDDGNCWWQYLASFEN